MKGLEAVFSKKNIFNKFADDQIFEIVNVFGNKEEA